MSSTELALPLRPYRTALAEKTPKPEREKAEVRVVSPDEWPEEENVSEAYLPGGDLIEAVDIALTLRRPLLIQGEPGCGKTRLAYHVASVLGWPLETAYLKSSSKAQELLYQYDALARLYESQRHSLRAKRANPFITLGPLGRAIARSQYGRPSVFLLDEIDKADIDFPNDLLREMDRMEFDIPEVVQETGNLHKKYQATQSAWPLILVTHNEEKGLPPAFLRRCIYHYVQFPATEEELFQIIALHWKAYENAPLQDSLANQAVRVLGALRKINGLSKKPGLSELLDWVRYLHWSQKAPLPSDAAPLLDTLRFSDLPEHGVLLKSQADRETAMKDYQPPR